MKITLLSALLFISLSVSAQMNYHLNFSRSTGGDYLRILIHTPAEVSLIGDSLKVVYEEANNLVKSLGVKLTREHLKQEGAYTYYILVLALPVKDSVDYKLSVQTRKLAKNTPLLYRGKKGDDSEDPKLILEWN